MIPYGLQMASTRKMANRSYRHFSLASLLIPFLFCCAVCGAERRSVDIIGRVMPEPGGSGVPGVAVRLFYDNEVVAKTDKNGEYCFKSVEPNVYAIRTIERPAGEWSEGVVVRVANDSVRADDLYLKMPQSISGLVSDAKTGEPVVGARIRFSTADKNWDAVTTDEEGKYRLYVAARKVTVQSEGTPKRYYPQKSTDGFYESRQVVVEDNQRVEQVDFQVHSAPKLIGQVLDSGGKPAKGVSVYLHVNWSGGKPIPGVELPLERSSIDFGSSIASELTTDEEGRFVCYQRRFSMPRRTNEKMKITAVARSQDGSAGGFVDFDTDSDDRIFEGLQVKLTPTVAVEVRVVDPKGKPIARATPNVIYYLRRYIHLGYEVSPLELNFQSVGKGRFRAMGLTPGLQYELSATAEGYHSSEARMLLFKPGTKTHDAGTFQLKWWDRRALMSLLIQLESEDRYQRESACNSLAALGPEAASATAALVDRLKNDPVNTVRYAAAEALGKIGPAAKTAVDDLIESLNRDGLGVDREAARALGLIGDASAVPALRDALASRESEVRSCAVVSLGQLAAKSPDAVKAIITALDDDHHSVQAAAANTLGRLGPSAELAVPALIRNLENAKGNARPNAAMALGLIGDQSALPALRRAITDSNVDVFRNAAIAIRRIEARE